MKPTEETPLQEREGERGGKSHHHQEILDPPLLAGVPETMARY